MRLLLDSHVALWWLADDDSIGPVCRRHIENADEVFVSVITPWELGIKRALGKLVTPDGLVDELCSTGFTMLSVSAEHAETAPDLPTHHRDPFDRMLIAQAQLEHLTVVSADRVFADYDVETLAARS